MKISDELALSYYKTVASIDSGHSVQLVQHTETKKFFVKKHLGVYHLEIYQELQKNPVRNIPRIECIVEDESGLTVIEEYIQGDTLQKIIDSNGPLQEAAATDLVIQLCQIVSDLHHRSPAIIHRDIKPSNVILSPDGVIKLLDLNAAKYSSPDQFRDTTLLGTAGFAAPEQYGFAPSSVQSDLFAIGVLTNVLITGKMPVEAKAKGKLAHIIEKCTELDPANRYASVDDLISALKRTQIKLQAQAEASKSWRRYLPPGFRSGSGTHMIIAILGYALILFAAFSITVENESPLVATMNKIGVVLIGLIVVLFSSDYCGIQSRFPLARSQNKFIRVIGAVLIDIIAAFLLISLLLLIESFV